MISLTHVSPISAMDSFVKRDMLEFECPFARYIGNFCQYLGAQEIGDHDESIIALLLRHYRLRSLHKYE